MHFRIALGLTLAAVAGCSEGTDETATDTRPQTAAQDGGAADPASVTTTADAAAAARDASLDVRSPPLDGSSDPSSTADAGQVLDASDAMADTAAELSDAGMVEAESCLRVPSDYTRPGSYGFSVVELERTKVWLPELPPGCRAPIVHFSNGTGATCESYADVLRTLASHGFVTACAESTNTGDGTPCIDAIAAVRERYPALVSGAVGSAGHHTGGAGALLCLGRTQAQPTDSARRAGYAVAPAAGTGGGGGDWMVRYGELRAPTFVMRGSNDMLVSKAWVKSGFDALADQTESYWFEAIGANHLPLPLRWMHETAVAWFRWQLLGDKAACRHLKALPALEHWELEAQQAPSDC